ncbi:DUF4367 domain-containing protein [Paenibacillus sp.]|jgi:hypothetical protein|uniref:DUF4367 domain-containing protein n=1 Tax=Paenibacillus sp. TaxID=58172 RepID=UPI00281BC579|nr:DUF4367 domain-containing protein [Paenibacillus sp.]MDR0268320.1 DUF4367 domain-containing protein [Paenibacillus sp.]
MTNKQAETVIQNFDVTDKVMERVYQFGGWKQHASKPRFRPGVGLAAMIAFIIMGASATGYAASQYIQIQNNKGETVLETVKQTDNAKKLIETEMMYNDRVIDQLNPGDYAAYYINDDVMKSADPVERVKFIYKLATYNNFDEFQALMERTQAPLLKTQPHLPEGYHFDYGDVTPKMIKKDSAQVEMEKLTEEFIRQAKTSANGEDLLIKKLEWKEAEMTHANFSKGNDSVMVTISKWEPRYLMQAFQDEQDVAEKINIHGVDAFYIRAGGDKSPEFGGQNKIGWIDETNQLYYNILDNETSKLTKEDMVKIAESLIPAH